MSSSSTVPTTRMNTTSNQKSKKIITVKKRIIANPNTPKLNSRHSTFRLFDFQAFDNDEAADDNSSNGSQPSSNKCSAKFRVQMFGINELGETCLMYVDGYNPFFYVKVSQYWTQHTANSFADEIRKAIFGYYASCLKSVVLVEHNQLYEFTENKKFKFLKLTFQNMMTFNKVRNLWFSYDQTTKERKFKPYVYNGVMYGEKLQLYESKIPPLLRYLHIHQISPSGWVEVQKYIPMNISVSTCTYEYICTPNQIKPLPQKETPVPYNICSFDIEASSSHGDFPLPKKTYKRLATQIVDAFSSRQESMGSTNTTMSIKTGELALKKMILTAFGYDKDQNIDSVYPKTSISKDALKSRITILQKNTLEALEEEPNITNDKNKKQFWKITSSFEKLANDAKSLQKYTSTSATTAADDGDPSSTSTTATNQDGVSDVVMEGGFGSAINEIPENAPIFNRDNHSSNIDALQADKGKTMIDILLCTDYTREIKIDAINRVLTDDPVLPELKGDEVTFIGTTFMKYGANEPHKNHCLVVGSCDPIPNVEVQTVKTETDCLLEWSKLINKENPDIIIGYNIFGFDYQFMFQRALELNCVERFTAISRVHRDLGYTEHYTTKAKSLAQTKNRLASGDYELHYPAISGRLQIDLLFYFRRDYNMASYKLDDVAGSFIRDDIQHLIPMKLPDNGEPCTHIYSKNIMGLHAQDFIHLEITSFTVDYYQKGKKFQVVDILLNQEHPEETSGKKYNIIIIAGHYPDLDPTTQKLKWGMSKDDVTPQDIFRLSRESSTSRAVVAKYCIQDCNLVQHLMKKTDVLTGYNEMSRICNVPISFLVFRGQGIKLTSYVAKICREKDTLMPDLQHTPNDDGYEGAIVLPPKCAMYGENPVACNDYSSLYPSIAKGWNLSPDSKVWTKLYDLQNNLIRINDIVLNSNNQERLEKDIEKYDNRPNYRYIETRFDHFETVQRMTANGKLGRKEKVKAGVKVCRWALFPNNGEGIIPCIIGDLLKARKETRVKAESESDPFIANVLDKRQLGYKVTANSLYGQMGSSVSTFFEKDVAASITSIGRQMITYARRMVEEIYGNSVYDQTEGKIRVARTRSQYVYGDSVAAYTPVYIRYGGHVIDILTVEDLAKKYGGNNWIYCTEPGKQDKEFCELIDIESWTENGWTTLHRVIRHALAPHKKMLRVLTHTGTVDVTDDHSLLRKDGTEISPTTLQTEIDTTELLHHSLPSLDNCSHVTVKQQLLAKQLLANPNVYIPIPNGLDAAVVCGVVQQHGDFMIHCTDDAEIKNTMYYVQYVTGTEGIKCVERKTVKKMHEIAYDGFVYDLTTDNHHFAAGVGNLIVHNTDSVFFTFNLEDAETGEPIRGKRALELTIEIAQESAELCSLFLPPPMKLAYEKTLMSFILLSKKRYVGMLYETDPNKGKLKFMGLPLKRRDSCDYVKDVYGGILTILMKEPDNIQKAIEFLNHMLKCLVKGEVSMEKLAITKALRSDYKNPKQIAHRVLADRMGERDPGNKPKPGDRIKYVFVRNQNNNNNNHTHSTKSTQSTLLGDRIETPAYIVQNKVPLDYTYYITNQLMNPLQQLLGLALDKIYECKKTRKQDVTASRKIIQELQDSCSDTGGNVDLEQFMKKREKYCSSQVKQLLFDPFLTEIYNAEHGIRTIMSFYQKK